MTLILGWLAVILSMLVADRIDHRIESYHQIERRNWRIADDYTGGAVRIVPEEEK